jgi:hypothetical protein
MISNSTKAVTTLGRAVHEILQNHCKPKYMYTHTILALRYQDIIYVLVESYNLLDKPRIA